jgi:hypothetical protein
MNFQRIAVRIAAVVPVFLAATTLAYFALGQVIEYQADGMKYQTLTRKGLTVIITHLPAQVAGYGLIQVSIANGAAIHWTIGPEDFQYVRGATTITALGADTVVNVMLNHASGNDLIKLITSYERALYAIPNMKSNNGYEQRREGALAFGGSPKLKAAAAAAALTLAQVRLAPGESTDGAVFMRLPKDPKALTGGHVVLHTEGETFEFNTD